MRLGPREIIQSCPIRALWDDAKVYLQARAQDNRAARRASRFHLLDVPKSQKMLHERLRLCAGGENVDVPYRLLPASIATGYFQILDPWCGTKMLEQWLDQLFRVSKEESLRIPFEVFDGSAEVRSSFFPKAHKLFDATDIECFAELTYRGNSQRVIELLGPFGTEVFESHQVGHGRRVFAVQLFESCQRPRP